MYLYGTLTVSDCFLGAVAHWSSPDILSTGFDCHFNSGGAVIRPSDGRLIYTNTLEDRIREFHCDDCPYEGPDYPPSPLDNDPLLPMPGCVEGSVRFLLAPEGHYLYICSSMWFDEVGSLVHDDDMSPLLHLGYDGHGLTEDGVIEFDSGILSPSSGYPTRSR